MATALIGTKPPILVSPPEVILTITFDDEVTPVKLEIVRLVVLANIVPLPEINPRLVLAAKAFAAVITLTIGAEVDAVPPLAIGKTPDTFEVRSILPANCALVILDAAIVVAFPDEVTSPVCKSSAKSGLI